MCKTIAILFGVAIAIGTFHVAYSLPTTVAKEGIRRSDGDAKKSSSAGPAAKLDANRVWLEVGPAKASELSEATTTDIPKSETTTAAPKSQDKDEKGKEKEYRENAVVEDDLQVSVDGSGDRFLDGTANANPKKEEQNRPVIVPRTEETNNKCQGVRCSPPPNGFDCSEIFTPPPTISITLPKGSCCPVHSCRRNDGSTYYHYAVEVEAPQPLQEFTTNQALPPWNSQFQQQKPFHSTILGPNPLSPIYPALNGPQNPSQFGYYNIDVGRLPQGNTGGINYPQQGLSLQNGNLYPFATSGYSGSFPAQLGLNNRRFSSASAVQKLPEQVQSQSAPINSFSGISSSVDSGNPVNRFSRGAFPNPNPNFNGLGQAQAQVAAYSGGQAQFGNFDSWYPRARRDAFQGFASSYTG